MAHGSLAAIDVLDPNGTVVGWLLGHAIDTERELMIRSPFQLVEELKKENVARVEQQLYTVAGRYVVILLGNDVKRLYLDPSGSLSVMYSVAEPVLGSTPQVIGHSDPAAPDLVASIGTTREKSGTWYPCGQTPWRNLRVLMPNHYLDLEIWDAKRHWPVLGSFEERIVNDHRSVVAEIGSRITRNIRAVVKAHPTTMSLTAGRDTRMLLACARPMVDRLIFVTSHSF